MPITSAEGNFFGSVAEYTSSLYLEKLGYIRKKLTRSPCPDFVIENKNFRAAVEVKFVSNYTYAPFSSMLKKANSQLNSYDYRILHLHCTIGSIDNVIGTLERREMRSNIDVIVIFLCCDPVKFFYRR